MSKTLMKLMGLVLTLGLLAVACGSDSDGENAAAEAAAEAAADEAAEEAVNAEVELDDIVTTAVGTGQFPTLVAAVQAAGLVETLQGEGPFTVFAPTEDAFAAALDALGLTADELLADTDTLTTVLTYHVIAGEVPAETVVTLDGQSAATVQGEEIAISIDGSNVMVNQANVVTADVFASNGVIHVIDSVLLPPTVVEALGLGEEQAAADIVGTAVAAGQFPTLIAAVEAAGLVETLQGEGPFTVFAPTEDAFAAALDQLGLTAEELLADTDTLSSVLTYHVIAGEVPAADVLGLDGQSVATVNGAEIGISIVDGNVVINDSTVVLPDVFASNGVIHVIDTVLLPPS